MERQRIYNQQVTANPSLSIRQAQIPAAPQDEGAGYGLLRTVGNAGVDIVKLVARDYAREWQGRVIDAVLRTNDEFERWKTEYMRTRQGVDALTAQEDFANKYAELSQQAVAEFGNQRGNEIYRAGLERELTRYGLYAVKAGGDWQMRQDEAWQKSQWDAQLSSFQKIIEDNPLDSDMLNMERETLIQSWRAKNPGLDDGAIRDKLRSMEAQGRMNALLARGESGDMAALDHAERLLGGGSSGGGISGNWNGRARTSGAPGEAVNLVRAAAKKHGVPEELALAVMMQESDGNQGSVSHAGAIGLMQLMPGTARELGVNPHDAAQNAESGVRYLKQMLDMFGGNVDDALAAYNWGPGAMRKHIKGGRSGAMPKEAREYATKVKGRMDMAEGMAATGASQFPSLPGLSASEQVAWHRKIEALRKHNAQQTQKALEQALIGNIRDLVSSSGMLDYERQKAAVFAELEKIAEPELRKKAISLANSELEFQKDLRKAKTSAMIYGAVQDWRTKNMSPIQVAEAVNGLNLNPEDTKIALEMYNGKLEENELNMRALSGLRIEIDKASRNGSPMTDESIYRFAYDRRLTTAQLREALKYRDEGGNLGGLKQSEINNIWVELQGMRGERKKAEDAPAWLYGAVRKLLPEGKNPNRDEIRRAIAQALVEGTAPGWFGLSTNFRRGEAMAEGRINEWRPKEDQENELVY